jgi:UDP-glucuronate 4-epimerase
MNIFLTGGAGFIGSHFTESLLEQGHTVVCLDNFDNFYDRSIKERNLETAMQSDRFRLLEGDIRDRELLGKAFSENKIDLIVHLAAKAGVRPSVEDPREYFDVNINGTINILENAHKHSISKMIFASSSSVYGNNEKIPFAETDFVDHPISPYAASKKSGELLCYTYHSLYNMDISCLRFFTVYGPRQRPDLAIHKFARLVLEGKAVPVYGDGSFKRDFTYIDDTVSGISKAIKNLHGFNVYNFGNSRTISVMEMISELEEALGKEVKIDFREEVPGDVRLTYADISKSKREIGYNPQYDFKTGIRNFVKWLKEDGLHT